MHDPTAPSTSKKPNKPNRIIAAKFCKFFLSQLQPRMHLIMIFNTNRIFSDLHKMMVLACLKCNKTFPKIFGEKRTKCEICSESLYFQCLTCSKRYKFYTDLTSHIKYTCTNKQKNVKCQFCDYKTTHNKRLQNHYKNVHAPKSSVGRCDKCGKHFKSVNGLRKHVKTGCRMKP